MPNEIDAELRGTLPPDRVLPGVTTYNAKDPPGIRRSSPPPHRPEPPNVVIALIDDVGFGLRDQAARRAIAMLL